jgi:Cu(I)/Ag(I) efflux system periplasmic protein CusF
MIMKRFYLATATVGLAAALAACSPKAEDQKTAATAPAATTATPAPALPATSMSKMGMAPAASAAAKTGDSTGEITAIDPAAGTVTLKHEPIPGVGWPAMTMAFKASPPTSLTGLKVGDKVKFSVRIEGDDNTVTAISKL